MGFGNTIRDIRMSYGWTQNDLAETIGVSAVTIRNWESEKKTPSMSAIISICELFNISSDYLLGIRKDNYLRTKDEISVISTFRKLSSVGKQVVLCTCLVQKELEENRAIH